MSRESRPALAPRNAPWSIPVSTPGASSSTWRSMTSSDGTATGRSFRPRDRLLIEQRHDEGAARELGTVDATSELVEVLGTLAPRQRAVLALRYFDDLSEAQVAEIMGCSVGTVKSTASRALERLRTVLVPVPTGPVDGDPRTSSDAKE